MRKKCCFCCCLFETRLLCVSLAVFETPLEGQPSLQEILLPCLPSAKNKGVYHYFQLEKQLLRQKRIHTQKPSKSPPGQLNHKHSRQGAHITLYRVMLNTGPKDWDPYQGPSGIQGYLSPIAQMVPTLSNQMIIPTPQCPGAANLYESFPKAPWQEDEIIHDFSVRAKVFFSSSPFPWVFTLLFSLEPVGHAHVPSSRWWLSSATPLLLTLPLVRAIPSLPLAHSK